MATERGRFTVKHLVVGVLVPALVALGALVAGAAPASAAPAASQTGSALVSESFTGSTVTDGSWRALGDGCLTRATVAPGSTSSLGVCALRVGSLPATASTGYLQLTDATGSRKGGAVYTKASPSALGLDVTFDQWQYGTAGSGGDGLSFFIADGAASITSPGGQGSSLGYAQNTNQPPAPNGIAGAYLGVGLDAHGAFASSSDGHGTGCATGQSATFQANSVVLRGPGAGKSGYCYLAATNLPTASQKLHVTVTDPSVVTPAMARKFRVTVSPDRFPTVTVYAGFPANADLTQVLQYKMTDAAPATYQFGFAASSGSVVDTHLIGNVSASTVAPVDTTPPLVTITGGATALVATTTPKLSGTTDAAAGSTMTVLVGSQQLSATVGPDGTWTITPAVLAQGPVSVSVSATDAAGNTGTATQELTVDTVAPAVTITGGATALVATTTPNLSGTTDAAAGSTMTVLVGSQQLSATAGPDGTWSITPAVLAQGPVSVSVSATDAAGNTGTATQGLTVDTVAPVVTITGGASAASASATPLVAGTTDAPQGTAVNVKISDQVLIATAQADGAWSVTPATLGNGTVTISATTNDPAGNTGTATQLLTITVPAPTPSSAAPTITISGGATALSNLATPTISGTSTGVAGRSATVTVGGQTLTSSISPTGDWSVVPTVLTQGSNRVVVVVSAASGLKATSSQVLTVDTIAPAIVIDGGSAVSTDSSTPTISGRVDVPAGSKIKVGVDEVALEVVVSSTRTWSVTSSRLAAGSHTVVVSATDAAGNVGTGRQRLTVIPVLSIDGGAARLTKDAAPTISGTTDAPISTTVTVTVDGQTLIGTVTAPGIWSVTSRPLPSTVYPVKATVRDSVGNLRTAWQNLTVDLIAPAIVIDGGSVVSTKNATPTISGRVNVPAGSSMSVVVDGVALEVVVSSTRTWSVTSPSLTAGAHTVVVSATDAAGNTGTQQQRLTVIG